MAFCFFTVTAFSAVFGSQNSVAGVVVLLALLVLRQADFGIRTTHGLLCIAGIFMILIIGPRFSNVVSPLPALLINLSCIFLLMLLGCHNVIMYNHSTFVLGYLLLLGYDVTGKAYQMRVISLLFGMCLCMAVFYKNQKNRPYHRTFFDLFHEFTLFSARKPLVYQADFYRIRCYFYCLTTRTAKSNVGRDCLYVRLSSVFSGQQTKSAKKRGI